LKFVFRKDTNSVWAWAYIPVALFILVAVFQLIPLPSSAVNTISPNTVSVKEELLGDLPNAESLLSSMTLSFYANATKHDLRLVLAVAAIFAVVLNVFRRPEQVNAVVDSYITYHSTSKRMTSAEVMKILQTEKAKRGKELTEKLKATMDFKRENIALALEHQRGNIILQRLERLSVALTQAQLTTIENKSIYESTKTMVSDPARLKQFIEAQRAKGVYISTGSERAQLKSKLDQLELSYADLLRQVTSDHPSVKALESNITRTKQQIAD
ncbi:unnamed protein product, partial [marine sediment metagenome]